MSSVYNRCFTEDCVHGMRFLDSGEVDLVFADPPFNIGFGYDACDDSKSDNDYLIWTRNWLKEVKRVLKPTGAFWLAIGDDYAAELKVMIQREFGMTCRSWVIWHYTFGVNCARKFTRFASLGGWIGASPTSPLKRTIKRGVNTNPELGDCNQQPRRRGSLKLGFNQPVVTQGLDRDARGGDGIPRSFG